jgi:phage terminase small subunit
MTTKLTEKQRRFVEAYMGQAKGNATEAARLAGYSGNENALSQRGFELVRNSKVSQAIEERRQACPLVMSREQLQEFWSRVALGQELDGDDVAAMRDRLKASELLARTQGAFVEKVEHSGPDGGPITVARTQRTPEERRQRLAELQAILEQSKM